MNYDRIILELLDRVAALEEEVKKLKGQAVADSKENAEKEFVRSYKKDEIDYEDLKNPNVSPTVRAVNYIRTRLLKGLEDKEEYVDIVALQVEHGIGTKMRSPLVCNAMRKDYGYEAEVIRDTPTHMSTTYTIRYYLNRPKED